MELKEFIAFFASLCEETEFTELKPETRFREIDEWSSLMALSLIAEIREIYNVQLSFSELKTASTIEDIFIVVKNKSNL